MTTPVEVYVESGSKKTFAGAIEWPGWCRSGKDEASALKALFEYGPRYGKAMAEARIGFRPPRELAEMKVIERLKGGTTTDFGAPGTPPALDRRPVDDAELQRLETILDACWGWFDRARKAANRKTLRTGPRGGGRNLKEIGEHVVGADAAYLSKLGWKAEASGGEAGLREALRQGMAAAAHGELPARGPRGGLHWSVRYFVRRSAWHLLDHAWEIEDRLAADP
jgi:hypothetical protein